MIRSLERSSNDISVEHEEIYRQFLCGKLVYRPNPDSDDGKVEMLIADLVNPLEGDFNLAKCEKYPDMDRILMISTGYRKAKEFSDANRTHVRIVPKFVIERDLRDPRTAATAFPYKDIMKNWSEECPFGIFVTWGNWDEMSWYDYLITSTSEELSNNESLYDNWKDSRYHGFMERAYSVLSRGRTRESDGTWAERAKLFTIEF